MLSQNKEHENKIEIEEIDIKISDFEALENSNKLKDYFQTFSENPENINMSNMWKLLKKLWPRHEGDLSSAKINHRTCFWSN